MSQAKAYRERIGDMLIAAGLVTPAQVEEALRAQRSSGARLGKQLVSLGHVSELQLAQTLSNQLSIPWVSLERIEFSRELLARVSAELAERYSLMPIYIRSVRDQGDTLYIATEDPTDERALQLVSQCSGLPVRAMIAAPSDIRRAIDRHYFAELPAPTIAAGGGLREVLERAAESLHPVSHATATRLKAQPPPAPNSVPPPAPRIEAPPAPRVDPSPAAPATAATGAAAGSPVPPRPSVPPPLPIPSMIPAGSEPMVPLEEYETPSKPPTRAPRTLTLLDGTQVAIPNSRSKRFAQEILEVRQVVRAIRAASADAGIEDPPTWHDVVQIVLDALAAKGVRLTRKDVAEAYIRVRERPNTSK
ncbi:MAG: hypothetical protein QM778_08910 [Myxococcales bacterium]